MSKVPTDQNISARDRGYSNVECIIQSCSRKNAIVQIEICEVLNRVVSWNRYQIANVV